MSATSIFKYNPNKSTIFLWLTYPFLSANLEFVPDSIIDHCVQSQGNIASAMVDVGSGFTRDQPDSDIIGDGIHSRP